MSWTARALLAAALVFAGRLQAQDLGGAAKIVVMTGRVSVLRDGNEWASNLGDVVQPKQLIVTGEDGYAKLQLSDGSTFEVFKNTRVILRDTPGWTELLNVLIGRVKIYIEHKNGPNPNRVTTQTAIISVRGTVFDVDVEDEDATTLVSVDEGAVDVRHARFGGNGVLVHAGESLRVYRDQPLARVVDKGNAAQVALRAAARAVYDALYQRSINGPGSGPAGVPGGGTGGTPPGQGDKGKSPTGGTAPPPAPPPAPPAQ